MRWDHRAAVLVASKNGESTIATTVRSAANQTTPTEVYVVSDGSDDKTAQVAEEAGAIVLDLDINIGKPAALHRACHELGLFDAYEFLAVLDDDTTIAPDFVEKCLARFDREEGTAIIVGRTLSDWADDGPQRWNVWVAWRAYAYWRYQVTIRPGQDAFNALNCISGSNSMYRTTLLREVLVEKTPYIVDDTYWVLETHRRKLGRVRYEPDAWAWVQDPTNGRDWYKQNLRWLWGTCQGIIGHRAGTRRSWFDFWYVTLMFDWLVYIFFWPLVMIVLLATGTFEPKTVGGIVVGIYGAWATAAAWALRKWRLILFTPFLIAADWIYRVNFTHAIVKAIRQPTVESCTWDSPTRYKATKGGE